MPSTIIPFGPQHPTFLEPLNLRLRIEVLRGGSPRRAGGAGDCAVDESGCRRITAEAGHLKRLFGISPAGREDIERSGLLLAFAYPDRIAQRRENAAEHAARVVKSERGWNPGQDAGTHGPSIHMGEGVGKCSPRDIRGTGLTGHARRAINGDACYVRF